MTVRQRSLLLGLLQVGLVLSLGGKLLVDRLRLPRGWAKVVAYDPDDPFRGRYVRLQLVVPASDSASALLLVTTGWPRLQVRGDTVVTGIGARDARQAVLTRVVQGDSMLVLRDPVAFFIPEHVPDPSVRPAGEQLWVEVTVPTRGPPRPIRLGVSRNGGPIIPMEN